MKALRITSTFALWTVLGLLFGLLAITTVPRVVGWVPYTVLTGSMQPSIAPGDVVLDKPVQPQKLRAGDVVTFPDPANKKRMITHRVRRVDATAQTVRVITRGDANNQDERWSAPADGRVGRVEARVPMVGHVLQRIHSPFGRMLLLVVPALLLAIVELRAVWRPAEEAVPA
jgi:signal peptidase I